jgi:hypothetical protein
MHYGDEEVDDPELLLAISLSLQEAVNTNISHTPMAPSTPLHQHQQSLVPESLLLPASGLQVQAGYKMVLVVRSDLDMSVGKIVAQCCHASINLYRIMHERYRGLLDAWERDSCKKVSLKVDSEHELYVIAVCNSIDNGKVLTRCV